MKTAKYTFYLTKNHNIMRITKYNDGTKKRISMPCIYTAREMSIRIYNAIEELTEGEELIITCKLKENGDN